MRKTILYGLAIYGVVTLYKGCENATASFEVNKLLSTDKQSGIINKTIHRSGEKTEPSRLEKSVDSLYVR